MNNSRSWALGSKSYKQLEAMDDMNDCKSHKAQDIMNNSGYG